MGFLSPLTSWDLTQASGDYWNKLNHGQKITLTQGFLLGIWVVTQEGYEKYGIDLDSFLIYDLDYDLVEALDDFYSNKANNSTPIMYAMYLKTKLTIEPEVKPDLQPYSLPTIEQKGA